jgi:hypothetical protein
MRWKEACYEGTDVMERSCAVARGKDINNNSGTVRLYITAIATTIIGAHTYMR